MKDFFRGRVFKICLCILALVIGIMVYQAASGNFASVPEAVVGTVATPVAKVSSTISDKVAGFFNMLLNAKDTAKENVELKKQLSDSLGKLSDLERYKKENEQLKDFLEIKELNPDYKMKSAQVIGRDTTSRFGKFTLNKGEVNGIEINDPVITADGLVGIVSHIGPTYSVVTTLLDPEINVGVYNTRTQETGIVSGDASVSEKGNTKLKLLPRDTGLLAGDVIQTSGIGGFFPEGFLIGTIEAVRAENSGVSMYAEIKPIVEISNVSNVMILTDFSVDEKPDQNSEKSSQVSSEEQK